jgi:3-dehydroquinate synthetase
MMATRRLRVELPGRTPYEIRIGYRLYANLGVHLREAVGAGTAVLAAEDGLDGRMLEAVKGGLAKGGYGEIEVVSLVDGGRGPADAMPLMAALARQAPYAPVTVIALGGEPVMDIASFAVANMARELPLVLLPTTLAGCLETVAASGRRLDIGGSIGAVAVPASAAYAACDLSSLASQSPGDWRQGLAESARVAIATGGDFAIWLDENCEALAAHDEACVQQAIVQALSAKAGILAKRPEGLAGAGAERCGAASGGDMRLAVPDGLGLGLTFARAFRAALGNAAADGGVACAEGLRFAAFMATEAIGAPMELALRQDGFLRRLGLERPDKEGLAHGGEDVADAIFAQMLGGRPEHEGGIRFVLASGMGELQAAEVDPDLVKIYLMLWQQSQPPF